MIERYVHQVNIQSPEWGMITLLYPLQRNGSDWGVFESIKDTLWGQFLPVIQKETLQQAILGRTILLMKEIGRSPRGICQMISPQEGLCRDLQNKTCLIPSAKCRPGKKTPFCYSPPEVIDEDAIEIIRMIVLAWSEQTYVVIVQENR